MIHQQLYSLKQVWFTNKIQTNYIFFYISTHVQIHTKMHTHIFVTEVLPRALFVLLSLGQIKRSLLLMTREGRMLVRTKNNNRVRLTTHDGSEYNMKLWRPIH